ncbi:MAG: adenylate/guanylate cyclase domain-containing protein [Defluviitaleaceae bacterium]|nr:adenylate/guanylate cyclase domain-containing protein [Defluviitaleaceae bacterium]
MLYKKLKIILPVLLLLLFGLTQYFKPIPVLDNLLYDDFLCSEGEPLEHIIIVGMDERSINEIGTWPWPRFYMADAIEKLIEMEAAAIGINVLYDVYGISGEHDEALVDVASRTDRLVLAASGVLDDSLTAIEYFLPFDELAAVASAGHINVEPDSADGVLRRALTALKYGDITEYSLPMEVYRVYCRVMGIADTTEAIPFDKHGQFLIDYTAKPRGYTVLSFWGLINDEYHPAMFKDAIVLIGPYAQGIGSGNFPTPLDRKTPMYGVEINANIIQNMLVGRYKQEVVWWQDLLALCLFGLVAAVFLHKLKPVPSLVLTVALIAVYLAGAKLAYVQLDMIFRMGDAVGFFIVAFIGNLALGILAEQHEKNHIHGLFGRYVAPEVVSELMSGGVDIQLGGVEKEVTVLFVDIRGFTAFSEANPPDKVVSMVNRYLALTSRSIQEHGGTLDKYIGDATMAVFNAPNDLPNHALQAVLTGWAMKQGAVSLQQEILRDYGVDLQFGIGINTGMAVVGNMGSEFRMDYTVIGDTVNTAARLESNAQKGQVILSDATYQLVKDYVEVTDLGVLNVKNKKVGIQIYNLEGVRQ